MKYAYVGSFTSKERRGLGHGGIGIFCKTDDDSWKQIQEIELENPSYLCFGKDKRFVYSVHGDSNLISSMSVMSDGTLKLLNQVHSPYWNSAYCTIDPSDKYLLVCSADPNNYSGAIQVYSLMENGMIGSLVNVEIPKGKIGPFFVDAQSGVKPHQAEFDLAGKYLVEADKGLDAVFVYEFGQNASFNVVSKLQWRPGSCPRHVAFHPTKELLFLLTERFGTIVPCKYALGYLTPLSVYPSIPSNFLGLKNAAGEISVHPSGNWVYASNREHGSIVKYTIKEDGLLSDPEWCTDGISRPRFFLISRDGKSLYCANEDTHCVTIYDIDSQTGSLTLSNEKLLGGTPTCVLIKE